MKRCFLYVILVPFLLLSAVNTTALNKLTIEGTGDSQQLLRQLAQAFEADNPETKIIIPDSVGSTGGIKALIHGKCDMARIARPLKDSEKALGKNLVHRQFASSPVVFVANLPEPCIRNLTSAQLIDVFSGLITDWSQLGICQPHRIYVAMREEGDSSRKSIEKNIPGFKTIPQFTGKIIYSTPETVQILEDHPFTIGFLPKSSVGPKLTVFSLNGIDPDRSSIQNGAYPIVVKFGLVWRGTPSDLGAQFLAFIFSPQGEKIIQARGIVPVPDLK